MDLYETTIKRLIDSDRMSRSDRVLVVCAGGVDAKVLRSCGCSNITISNLAERWDMEAVEWMHEYAEALAIPDGSFDWTIVRAGLHHCASPHRALLEMYRVSRKGVIVFEARDSAFMRLAIRLGLVPEFELEAVVLEGWERGGVRNSAVPTSTVGLNERCARRWRVHTRSSSMNPVRIRTRFSRRSNCADAVATYRLGAACNGEARTRDPA
jgi:SAM-dependent methyltransferase